MAVEDLDDHAGAIQDVDARGALQVAQLARADLVIYRDQGQLFDRLEAGSRAVLGAIGALRGFDLLASRASLVHLARDLDAGLTATTRERRELGELSFTERSGRSE